MIAFDTDIFSAIYRGNAAIVARATEIPAELQSISIVTAEEVIRGHLNSIRKAESGKSKISVATAYEFFESALRATEAFQKLSFTDKSQEYFDHWKRNNG